jgi:hypothetical protein
MTLIAIAPVVLTLDIGMNTLDIVMKGWQYKVPTANTVMSTIISRALAHPILGPPQPLALVAKFPIRLARGRFVAGHKFKVPTGSSVVSAGIKATGTRWVYSVGKADAGTAHPPP